MKHPSLFSLFIALLLTSSGLFAAEPAKPAAINPNILLILADDMGEVR